MLASEGAQRPAAGHHFAGWIVALFIRIVMSGVSLRGAGRMLQLMSEVLGWSGKIPHWTTGRLWFLRWGLRQLMAAKQKAEDWAWLVDHSVQIGPHKCLVIVGIRLADLPVPGQCLGHGELKLIALEPVKSSTKETVAGQLEAAAEVTGAPRVIVDDHGADLHGGVRLFQQQHPQTVEIYDTKHKAACLLKGRLEKDEDWRRFGTLVGEARCAMQQTELACLVPPGPKPKARFMNLGPMLEWGHKALAVLRSPPVWLDEAGVRRLREKLGKLESLEKPMWRWAQWQRVVDVAVERVSRWGLYAAAATDLERDLAMALPANLRDASSQSLAEQLVSFVGEQSAKAAGQRLPGSTEVLESLFGRYKELEKQQAKGGFTSLLAGFGALVSGAASQSISALIQPIRQGLQVISTRTLIDWCRQKLGPTLTSLRRQTFAAALAAQQKPDESTA